MNQTTLPRTLPYYNNDTKTLFLNRIVNNPLVLKHNEGYKGKKINIYLTAITQEKEALIDKYLKYKKTCSKEEVLEFKTALFPIDINKILAYGNCNAHRSFANKIYTIFQTKKVDNGKEYRGGFLRPNENVSYRNYERPFEYWIDNYLVNMCPDYYMCWNSALRKVGFNTKTEDKPHYIVIWFDCLLTYNDIKNTHKL